MRMKKSGIVILISVAVLVLAGVIVFCNIEPEPCADKHAGKDGYDLLLDEDVIAELEWRAEYAKNPENPYNPEIFAYEASRGELRESYFGIRLDEIARDPNGDYSMSEAQRDTLIENLAGRHMCSLQWISWSHFGSVEMVPDGNGGLICKGGQKSVDSGDYLEIDGYIVPVSPIHLKFTGKIVTCVEHINDGRPVVRNGTYNFKVRGARSYWRMQELTNPADSCTDYVDIYFD